MTKSTSLLLRTSGDYSDSEIERLQQTLESSLNQKSSVKRDLYHVLAGVEVNLPAQVVIVVGGYILTSFAGGFFSEAGKDFYQHLKNTLLKVSSIKPRKNPQYPHLYIGLRIQRNKFIKASLPNNPNVLRASLNSLYEYLEKNKSKLKNGEYLIWFKNREWKSEDKLIEEILNSRFSYLRHLKRKIPEI